MTHRQVRSCNVESVPLLTTFEPINTLAFLHFATRESNSLQLL
jgi:hypothetical protein